MTGLILPSTGRVIQSDKITEIISKTASTLNEVPRRIDFYAHFNVDIDNIKKGEDVFIGIYEVPKMEWHQLFQIKIKEVPDEFDEPNRVGPHKLLEKKIMDEIAQDKKTKIQSFLVLIRKTSM